MELIKFKNKETSDSIQWQLEFLGKWYKTYTELSIPQSMQLQDTRESAQLITDYALEISITFPHYTKERIFEAWDWGIREKGNKDFQKFTIGVLIAWIRNHRFETATPEADKLPLIGPPKLEPLNDDTAAELLIKYNECNEGGKSAFRAFNPEYVRLCEYLGELGLTDEEKKTMKGSKRGKGWTAAEKLEVFTVAKDKLVKECRKRAVLGPNFFKGKTQKVIFDQLRRQGVDVPGNWDTFINRAIIEVMGNYFLMNKNI